MTDTTDQQAVTVAQEDRDAAKALWDRMLAQSPVVSRDDGAALGRDFLQAFARHRLASVSSASADYVLVPRVPTDAMVNAAVVPLNRTGSVRSVWSAMLAASPEPVPATNQAGGVERNLEAQRRTIEACAGMCDRMVADKNLPDEAHNAAWNLAVGIRALRPSLALATQPATSQEGEAIDRVAKAIYEAGGSFADQNGIIAWADLDGSNDAENFRKMARAALAAIPTPPTLSEDLRASVEALEPFARVHPHKNEAGCSAILIPVTVADVRLARVALAQVKAS